MSKYSIFLCWSEEDKAYIATVPELPGLSALGSSADEAMKELSIAQELYLEVLQEDGEEIPEPDLLKSFSGQTRIRLPKSLHESLSNEAKKEGVSLNTYIVNLLSERNALKRVKDSFINMENRMYSFMLHSSAPSLADVTTESGRNFEIYPTNLSFIPKGKEA
jgi:antitoxin HicB